MYLSIITNHILKGEGEGMFKKNSYELTNPQKNIWELEQINGEGTPVNHIFAVLKLKGILTEDILVQTINKIIESNDSFRLKFIKDGNSLSQYVEAYTPCQIEIRHFDTDNIESAIEEYKNLKLSINKTFSFCICFTIDNTYILYKTHHIISDAWSMSQVCEQIKEFYEILLKAKSSESANINVFSRPSYLEFIDRESLYKESKKYVLDKDFWEKYVSNIPDSKIYKLSGFEKKANRLSFPIESKLFNNISDYCSKNKITEYSFFLAILSLYYSKIHNINSMVFGTPFLNRQKRLNEFQTTGMFVSTLPLVVNTSSADDFGELCKQISSLNISLFKHSSYQYHKIQEAYSNYTNETSGLYEVGFSYQINKQEKALEDVDLGECTWFFSGMQNNPLTIHLTTLNNEKLISYDYLVSCINDNEIENMNKIIMHLISQILDGKKTYSEINLLTQEDKKSLLEFNNTGSVQIENKTVVDIFEYIVQKYPNNIAITCDDISVTYQELNKKINVLANRLSTLNITKNTPIALLFDKSIEMIISMFAVLKSGGCYVPILPDEDNSRIEYILRDCKPKLILTHKDYDLYVSIQIPKINVDKLNMDSICSDKKNTLSAHDVAYIIYTSGSTGNPKGTMVTHKNICNLKASIEADHILKASPDDVSLSLLKYSFDASGIDIYSALLFGGKLILVKKEDELNPEKIIRIMEKEKVSRSFLIPKWIEHIAIQDKLLKSDLSSLKVLGTGGETLKPYVLEHLLSKYSNLKVLNLYGPTETTMFTTRKNVGVYEIKNNYTSIGKPIYGARIAIVNSNLEFLPIDCEGELIVYEDDTSIKNIAKGYLNLDKQTNEKFIEVYNPLLNKKVKAYRTGDSAKINKNLEIDYIGRNDDIVKVNGGYLVALNEVQNMIQKLLGFDYEPYAIDIPYKNTKIIILFLASKDININLNSIRNHINNNMSFYMCPKKIIQLDEFPRNNSGKIDRSALKKIAVDYMEENKNRFIPPKTETEIKICNYLKEILGNDEISVGDDFIDDLGIDSLTLTALYTHLDNYNITIQDLYNNSNIRDLAYFIDNNSSIEIKPNLDNISNIKILNNVRKIDLSNILLTGSTGFLGIHILKDLLLEQDVQKIYCIIRNKINFDGKKRLNKQIEYYYNSDENLLKLIDQKVIILNGDISKNQLGLSKKTYFDLKGVVTCVINCAANTRHFARLDQLRADNVQSVSNLIDFCDGKIFLSHISTLSIAGFHDDNTENIVFDENTLYIKQKFNNNPYLITKFEAEKEILEANENGLKSNIFRLGNIMPRLSDGVFQQNAAQNVFLGALKSIVCSKVIAKDLLGLKLEFSPVDECSKMIVELLKNSAPNSIYHILNDKEISILEMKTLLKFLNCDILDVDLKTFIDEVSKNSDEYIKEYILSNNLNEYSQSVTLQILNKIGLEWAPMDISYMQKILKIIKEEM